MGRATQLLRVLTPADRDRFERFFCPEPNTGCWIWFGSTVARGYGQFRVGGTRGCTARSHRVALALYQGKVIPDGVLVRHACDNPWCVNPDHLQPGSDLDNTLDAIKRGRVGGTGPYPHGVRPTGSRFRAEIQVSGKKRHLGMYASIEEAAGAVRRAISQRLLTNRGEEVR